MCLAGFIHEAVRSRGKKRKRALWPLSPILAIGFSPSVVGGGLAIIFLGLSNNADFRHGCV